MDAADGDRRRDPQNGGVPGLKDPEGRALPIRAALAAGCRCGLAAWTAYAIAEFCFLSLLPWVMRKNWSYTGLHWRLTALLFACYAVLGASTGAAWGLILRRRGGALRAAAVLTVVLAFAGNLAAQRPLVAYTYFALAVSAAVAAGLLWAACMPRCPEVLRRLANPWPVSMGLVGVLWLAKEMPGGARWWVTAAYAGAVMVAALLARNTRPEPRLWPAGAAVAAIAVFAAFHWNVTTGSFPKLPAAPSASGSNVVLITLDTVRADHLSLYGYARDTTPNLRRLATGATVYTNAISASNMTLASHASLFTGLYPSQHGAHYSADHPAGRPLALKFRTLAERLAEKGYATAGVAANYGYLGRYLHMDQGFQYYSDDGLIPVLDGRRQYYLRQAIRGILTHFFSTAQFDAEYRTAAEINAEVLPLLGRLKQAQRPFFLFINYMDAHWPLIPPSPYDRLYPGRDRYFTSTEYSELLKQVLALKGRVTAREQEHLISQYDGGIRYEDFELGRLLERLKELGIYDNTLIVITADHGEEFGERNLMGHLVSVYQDEIHVPLLIKYPGPPRRQVVASAAGGVDVLPTILDVLRLPVPQDLAGQSLQNLDGTAARTIYSESFPCKAYWNLHPTRFRRQQRAAYSGTWKLISSTAGQRELYDLAKDPGEMNNLYVSQDLTYQRLESSLQRWLGSIAVESGRSGELNRDALERLRSLGYVQ